jgi:hypothetical protein
LDKIRADKEWCIVYDMEDDRWDVYCEGRHSGRCRTSQEADQLMDEYLNGERAY